MTYRDDRQALKDRIAELERQAAGAVSKEELEGLQRELLEARVRMDEDREALERLLARLDGKLPAPRTGVTVRVALVTLGLLVAAGAIVATGVSLLAREKVLVVETARGLPSAHRVAPARVEIDTEVEARMPTLDGCLPEGRHARIQAQLLFQGLDGAVHDVELWNVSEHDGYPAQTVDCLRDAFSSLRVPPFRSATYRYQLTLEWTGEGLARPPIWDRHARD